MRSGEQPSIVDGPILLCKRLRELRAIASALKQSDMTPLQICQALVEDKVIVGEVRRFFEGLPDDEKHYWIASLYALLMPESSKAPASYLLHTTVSRGIRHRSAGRIRSATWQGSHP